MARPRPASSSGSTSPAAGGSCDWSAAILVAFPSRVDGVTRTIAHYQAFSKLIQGAPTTVLVDPKQPGYAELPGAPFQKTDSWIIPVVPGVLFAALAALNLLALRQQLAHQRAHRRGRTSSTA